MHLDFETAAKEIAIELKLAADYLDCEKVLLHHLKKQVQKGSTDLSIEAYMKKLRNFFEVRIQSAKGKVDSVNDRYAAGFLNTLISTPYWHIWIRQGNL